MASEDLNGLGRRARTVREWRLQGRGRCEGAARARPHGVGDDRDERICTVLGGCRPLPAIPETERSEGYQSEDKKVAE